MTLFSGFGIYIDSSQGRGEMREEWGGGEKKSM